MISTFAAMDLNVSIAAEKLFSIGGFSITNSTVAGIIGLVVTIAIMFYVANHIKKSRYNRFVGLFQWVFEGLLGSIADIIPDRELARKIAPLASTVFFFVLINYWLSIVPGFGPISFNGVPLLRGMTADLNFTVALAIVTVFAVQLYAIRHLGILGNAKRYFRNPFKDAIGAFEGLLELVGEVSRGIALALRLFGNAFAGEVLLLVIGVLASYFASLVLPIFMFFELFIGFIQAYVFFVLTLIFTSLAVSSHGDNSQAHSSALTHKMLKQEE